MTWTRDALRGELLKMFEHHAQAGVKVTEKSQIVGDLGIDSLGVMEVVADIEDKFKLTIPDEALREVDTIGDVAKAIESRLQNEGRFSG